MRFELRPVTGAPIATLYELRALGALETVNQKGRKFETVRGAGVRAESRPVSGSQAVRPAPADGCGGLPALLSFREQACGRDL